MKLTAQIKIFSKISHLDRLLFTKHLFTMIKAGIPITEALESLTDQAKSPALKEVLTNVLADIDNGQSLAKSLGKYPKDFNQFYISMIEIGEEAGTLEKNLEFLAQQLTKDYQLRKKIQAAMLYPTVVFAATVIMGGFIALGVLPKLVTFFSAFEIELPFTTKILLWFANLMKNYGIVLFLAFFAFTFLFSLFLKLPKIKPWWHKKILTFPLFGNLLAYAQLARFSRNLGTLIKSGVPIIKSLDTTADTLSNLKFKNDLKEIGQILSQGKSIGSALESKKFSQFPPLVAKMVSVGEKTGKLEDTLIYLAEFFEDEIDTVSKNLTTILEPILLLSIGLIVGFVALAIISPIYELTGSIRR